MVQALLGSESAFRAIPHALHLCCQWRSPRHHIRPGTLELWIAFHDAFKHRDALAYENPAFLNGADGRLIRIVSEYLEPLARFRREQIQDTVVFFGSARFRGREEADHELELLDNTGSSQPAPSHEQPASVPQIVEGTATDLQRKRAVAAVEMARYYEDARRLPHAHHWAKDSLPPAPLCGHLRRRPGHYGSGQPRRVRSRRQDHRPQHPAAV
jgi:hypothetical protein